jgi:6-phosphofructokinase
VAIAPGLNTVIRAVVKAAAQRGWAASVRWWAAELEARTGKECRAVVLGHLQRGGAPTAWDRHLCTRFGVSAVELIAEGRYGHMVALTPTGIEPVLLTAAIDRLRTVPPDGELVRVGHALGISFGNE